MTQRQKLILPGGHNKLLLHSCCAPCSGEVMEALLASAAPRMIEISKRENFYQQEYCGRVYSLRDSNRWRKEQGRERIKICEKFYGQAEES
jgi:predicted adenine nucleotide alpha hydrolase (AANH) superfamily ATPase